MLTRLSIVTLTLMLAMGLGWAIAGVDDDDDDDNDELVCYSTLSRAQEVPDPGDSGTLMGGEIQVNFDPGFTQAMVSLTLEGDASTTGRAHLHCALPGEAGPIPVGIVDPGPEVCTAEELATGAIDCPLSNADFMEADCMSTIGRSVTNIAALFFAAREGLIYVNIHTAENPPGEVRGQLLCDD